MKGHPTTQEIANEIVRLIRSGTDVHAIENKLISRFGTIPGAAMRRAFELAMSDLEEAANQAQQEVSSLEALAAYGDDLAPGETIGDRLRRATDRGDPVARNLLDELSSPENQIGWALAVAAAEMHPDWYVGQNGIGRHDRTDGGERAVENLIDWFQRAHPVQAKAVEDEMRRQAGGRT